MSRPDPRWQIEPARVRAIIDGTAIFKDALVRMVNTTGKPEHMRTLRDLEQKPEAPR